MALRLLLLIGGIALLLAAATKQRIEGTHGAIAFAPPLLLPLALWAAWAAASFLWTLDPRLTAKEFQNEIVYTLCAFWLCFVAAQAPQAARLFGGALALGAIGVCVLALAQSSHARLSALQLHGGPGAFSSTLLVLFPCTLACAWFAWARGARPLRIALPLLLVPLYVFAGYGTQNRVVWIGFAVQAVLVALLLVSRPGLRLRAKMVVALAAAATVAGAATLAVKVHGERLGAAPLAEDPRPRIWRAVLERIEERPLTGTGFGRGVLRQELRAQGQNANLWHSHNLFLDAALQLGWPGLGMLVLLFGWTAALAWRLARSASDVAFACGLALLPLVAGTLVRNLTDVLWVRQSALLYWGMVGALLAWGLRAQPAAR